MKRTIILILLLVLWVASSVYSGPTKPSPKKENITLQGIPELGEFPGPPRYAEDPKKDNKKKTYYLQLPALSPRAASILQKFKELKKDPENNDLWVNYLKIFPETQKDFKKIFGPDDLSELYHNSGQYIFILQQAPENLKQQIIKLIFNITKTGAPGCCDAWSALYMVTQNYALNDMDLFMTSLKAIKQQDKRNIIKFMADVEAIKYSESYQNIINILKSKHENELAKEFEMARKKRIARPH